ncbi:MAG: terpene utilization protein AtuA, partial [Chromatocurvus sp.]
WADGYRAGHVWTMVGRDAVSKAQAFAEGVLRRTARALDSAGLSPLSETSIELPGSESQFPPKARRAALREVNLKIAVKHPSAAGVALFLKEMTGHALAAPPGLCGFAGARAKPSPVVRLFSFTVPVAGVPVEVDVEGEQLALAPPPASAERDLPPSAPLPLLPSGADEAMVVVPLETLARARSGDKGDKANIGVIARDPQFLPHIAAALTEAAVAACFAHFLAPGQARPVQRFYLPGTAALNFLLHGVLGGGGIASLRVDAQGKAYAQVLLTTPVTVPATLVAAHGLAISDSEDHSV